MAHHARFIISHCHSSCPHAISNMVKVYYTIAMTFSISSPLMALTLSNIIPEILWRPWGIWLTFTITSFWLWLKSSAIQILVCFLLANRLSTPAHPPAWNDTIFWMHGLSPNQQACPPLIRMCLHTITTENVAFSSTDRYCRLRPT